MSDIVPPPSVPETHRGKPLWHPFTPMTAHRREGVPEIVSADGFELIDAVGRRYLDGISSLWCNLHGHRVPAIDQAIRDQLDRVAHTTLLGLESDVSNTFAQRLVDVTPDGLDYVFFSDSGSTAVEAGLKMAWQYHRQKSDPEPQRDLFVTVANAYHGDTVGSVSVGAIDLFHSVYGPLLFQSHAVPSPAWTCWHEATDPSEHERSVLAEIESYFAQHGDRIAAFVVEPLVQGAAGILVHPTGFLRKLRELTTAHDTLLIADEVAVGFGRTGTLFACEQESVTPDILCLAKGTTGGYLPLAATLTSEEIYSAFLGEPDQARTFFHGHTYTGNPLACAAGLASLKLIEEHDLCAQANAIATRLERNLSPLRDHPHVGQIRCCGTMVGVELVESRAPLRAFPAPRRTGHRVTTAARQRGAIVRPLGDVAVLMPAPAMPLDDIDRLTSIFIESIDSATTDRG